MTCQCGHPEKAHANKCRAVVNMPRSGTTPAYSYPCECPKFVEAK